MIHGKIGKKLMEDNTDMMKILKDLKFTKKMLFSFMIITNFMKMVKKLSKLEPMKLWI
jgi:hypothetical protein